MDLKPMFLPILLSVALGPSLTESACSARLDDKVLGYIFSPTNKNTPLMSTSALDTSHGDYPDNSDCTYTIRTPPGTIVKLSWITFDVKGYMPTCWPKDYVEIFVGCDKKTIGKYCDSNSGSPFDMYSADNCMEIKFYSDGSDHGTGFMAKFEAFNAKQALLSSSTTRCSLSKYGSSGLSTLKGTIATTNWPLPYPVTGDSCYWRFGSSASSKGYKIAIMDFDTQYDFGCDDTK
ncbi:predicted protein [Nematostella vectensis]|uniref:CUB domain-containing protein n=2 Tax=Nematostella vectensis TaxID=45351 RepID=A7S3L6_NEMVE|nr:predicted protein [Nematostella vectensis]|eukprot:XP_001633808.1 predicted protein [Nematostella vectensis]